MHPSLFASPLLVVLLESHALAGSFGVGAAFVQDLPDAGGEARVGPGVSLQLPARIDLTSHASIRIGGRLDYAGGGVDTGDESCKGLDRISWHLTAEGGAPVRAGEFANCGWLAAAGLTAGPEVYLPVEGPVRPYLAGGLGLALVANFHDIDRPELMGPENDLTNPNNLDPWSLVPAFLTDVAVGAMIGQKTAFWVEGGYSSAWVGGADLERAEDTLDVRREPYGWNAVRLAAGVAFPL